MTISFSLRVRQKEAERERKGERERALFFSEENGDGGRSGEQGCHRECGEFMSSVAQTHSLHCQARYNEFPHLFSPYHVFNTFD
jgi:hypothetical protein